MDVSRLRLRNSMVLAVAFCAALNSRAAAAPGTPASVPDAREQLVLANKILAGEGLIGPFGHVSMRSSDGKKFLIAKHQSANQVTPGDIVEVDLDITPEEAKQRNLYLEVFIHSSIYREHSEIHAVVHTHAPYTVALGTLRSGDNRMLPTTNPGANLGNFMPVFPDIGLVADPEKGLKIARALQGQNGVLLRGHGAVVVGKSLEQAVLRAIYLEFEARAQMTSRSAGEPVSYTAEESDIFKQTQAVEHAWHYYEEKYGRQEEEEEKVRDKGKK
ncbi:MAG: class II aldolase/adducin family protein [Acidobacteria bacterium]|nr:class II aldolase/adducin family protein [Acidobacteriota bacterium]